MKKWEYTWQGWSVQFGPPTSSELDVFGADGWELVSVHMGAKEWHAWFKRPIIKKRAVRKKRKS